MRSDRRQVETPFDTLNPVGKPIDPIGHFRKADRNLTEPCFQRADPLFDLAHVVAQAIDRAANVAQVLQHDAFRFGHDGTIARIIRRKNA